MSVNYEDIIREIQMNDPTLPTIVNELTNVLQNPDASTFAVEDVMITDQSMTMKFLRFANTSFYRGGRDRVTDASEAVSNLGFEKIRNVILTTSLFKMFSGPSAEEKFSLTGLWKHSLGVASASRLIAKYLGKSWHERAYTCGLVHDIGKVARFNLDEGKDVKDFIKDSQLALDKKINFHKAELINGSPKHDILGYLICKNWGLSKFAEVVVRWHHEPNPELRKKVTSEEAHELIDVVIFANWAVNYLKFGFSGHETPDTPPDALLRRLNLDASQVDQIQADIENELKMTEDFCEKLDSGQESGGGTPKDRKSPIKFSKSLKHRKQRSWLDWFLNFTLSFFSKNKKEDLRSDWVGMLSSVSDCNEKKVKPFEVSKDIESILVDEIRSVFGKGKRNIDLLDESIQIADLMSADKNADVPSLSEEQMNLLMGEVKKTFHEPTRVSEPKAKESKDESSQKADSTDLQNDWVGTFAAISNIEEIKTLKGVPKEREDTLLHEVKNVFGERQDKQDLFDESIQIAGMMDTDGGGTVPQLSEEQKGFLMNEVRTAFNNSEEKEEVRPSLNLKEQLKDINSTQTQPTTEEKEISFDNLTLLSHIKELEQKYPRLLCLINEVSRLLNLCTENSNNSQWKKISSDWPIENKPLRWDKSETDWGMNKIIPQLPKATSDQKYVKLNDEFSDEANRKIISLFRESSSFDGTRMSLGIKLSQITEYFRESIQIAVIARYLLKQIEVDEADRIYQHLDASYLYFFCLLHNVGKIGLSVLNLEKDKPEEFGAQLVEYISRLKQNLAQKLKNFAPDEITIAQKLQRIFSKSKLYTPELQKSFTGELSDQLCEDVSIFSCTFDFLDDLKDCITYQQFYMFSERSREVEMYKKFSQIDFFILAKSILRNNTQAFSSSGQIKKIKKDLGEIGTSLGEINDELSRVEKASYFLAHLYSGEGFTNEKIQEYIGYYARDDASFSGQSLSNDELVLRVKERAFTDILSNTTPN